jgi:hypothetical protein
LTDWSSRAYLRSALSMRSGRPGEPRGFEVRV